LKQRPFPSLGAFTLVKYSQLETEVAKEENSSASVVVSPRKTRSMTVLEKAQNATPSKATALYQKLLRAKHEKAENTTSKAPINYQGFHNAEHEDGDDDEDDLQDESGKTPQDTEWSCGKSYRFHGSRKVSIVSVFRSRTSGARSRLGWDG